MYPETMRLKETEEPAIMQIRSKEGRSISIFYFVVGIDRNVELTTRWKDKSFRCTKLDTKIHF